MPAFRSNFESPDILLSNLIDALQEEYEEARKYGPGISYRLVDGSRVSETKGGYIYRFRMPRVISHLLPDTRINIVDYSGNVIKGEVLSIEGDVLTVFLERIPSSKDVEMKIDLSFLILELKKKLIAYKDHYRDCLSRLPLQVFLYRPVENSRINLDVPMDSQTLSILDELNENQRDGIIQSLSWNVAAIWGPPGTGKTKVLASLAILLASSGYRVLVTTYTHAALDRTLLHIKQLLEKRKIKREDLIIIRLGKALNPEVQEFEEDQQVQRKIMEKIEEIKKEVKLYESVLNAWHENKDKIISSAKLLDNFLELLEVKKEEYLFRIKKLSEIVNQLKGHLRQTVKEYLQIKRKGPSIIDVLLFWNWRKKKREILASLKASIRNVLRSIRIYMLKIRKYEEKLFKVEKAIRVISEKIDPLTRDCIKILASYTDGTKEEIVHNAEALKVLCSNKEWLYIFCKHGGEAGLSERINGLKNELDKMLQENFDEISALRKILRLKANIIACTLTKCVTELFDQVYSRVINCFDIALIDECSMANLGYIWVTSSIAKRVVLFGDPKQLPPITLLNSDSQHGQLLSTDIFSWAGFPENPVIPNSFLTKQYRMGKKICTLISNLFYLGKLISEIDFDGEVIFYDTTHLHTKDIRTFSKSRVNVLNAFVALKVCKDLLTEGYCDEDIAIVTPYRDQQHFIREILNENGLKNIAVGTIHTFQGSERKVVIIDLVRANAQGFFRSPLYYKSGERLLATAMSRAMEKLILIGPYNEVRKVDIPTISTFARQLTADSIKQVFFMDILPLKPEKVKMTPAEQFFFSENEAFEAVMEDLKNARKYVVIVSPYIKLDILRKFAEASNAPITVYMREETVRALSSPLFKGAGDKVIIVGRREKVPLKAIIIDDHILYDGSMNFLSPAGSLELVNRYDSYKNRKLWKLKNLFQPLNIEK